MHSYTSVAFTAELLEAGIPGSIDTVRGRRTNQPSDESTAHGAMTPPNDYSRINQGRHQLIDHILASHAMIGHLTDAATVPLDVPSIGTQPQVTPRRDPPSDHRPVVAHFDM